MKKVEIILSKDVEEVRKLVAAGYCPVECSFGGLSIVDELQMDHHGAMSDLESVAIRAYRDHFGARAEDPRFVFNHVDADGIYAGAALAGLLPHPQSAYAQTLPPFLQKNWMKDLSGLAETIAIIDTDPIGRDIIAMPFGQTLITWNALFGSQANDELGALSAIWGWKMLLTASPAVTAPFLNAAEQSEKNRCEAAQKDLTERGSRSGIVQAINGSRVFGFSEWYGRNVEAGSPVEVAGWRNPIVVALTEKDQNITFGCPNKDVAEALLGKGGLQNVFSKLNTLYGLEGQSGFGGRETVGGSPRGLKMSEQDIEKITKVINALVD